MNGLPPSWTSCEIGDIADVVGGSTPPSKDEGNFDTVGGMPWITPADLSGYRAMYIRRGARNLTAKGEAACSARKIPEGSVLFSSRAPIGYVAIAANCLTTNQGFKSLVLPPVINSRFIYYYMRHIKDVAEARATGTTFKELSGAATAKLPLVLAPQSEQQRIADKLDTLLARVDACRDRLDRVPGILKRFRQAVLAAATSGELTRDWREANPGSVAVPYRESDAPADATRLPEAWKWVAVGTLASKVTDGVHKKPNYVASGVPFISVKNLTKGTGIDFSETNFISEDDHREFCKRTLPERDDILVSKDGTLGVIRLIETNREFSIFVSVALIKLYDKSMSKYVRFALESPVVQKQMVGVGTGLQHIHLRDLRQDVVPMPPVAEQSEIIRRVENLLAVAELVEARFKSAVASMSTLPSAILNKGFRGELVPQDPKDEPASVLLERIRMERSAQVEQPKKRRRLPREVVTT